MLSSFWKGRRCWEFPDKTLSRQSLAAEPFSVVPRCKCHPVSSCVIQAFHFQKHAGEPKPRGRGGWVPGPGHRRSQHRPPALRARQEVPAHLQRAWPGEKGWDTHTHTHTHTHSVTHTANIAASNWPWQAIFPVQKALSCSLFSVPWGSQSKQSITEREELCFKGGDGH